MKRQSDIFRKVMWFDKRLRFDIDYFDLILPKRKVSSDDRYKSGLFHSVKCDRDIQYESGLELEFIKFLENSDRVKFYVDQPIKIPFWRGRKRLHYTPDFGVYMKTGEFVITEIKDLHGMLEDRVQCKTEGLMDFCSRMGFGLLLTDGKHSFEYIKKIKLNRTLEREILTAIESGVIRKRHYTEIVKRCGSTHNELLRVILKHDLYYNSFPFRLKQGGYNKVFREVFYMCRNHDDILYL